MALSVERVSLVQRDLQVRVEQVDPDRLARIILVVG